MNVRWSPAAAENLSRIFDYIRPDDPFAAERVVRTIYDSAGSLESFSNRGRVGCVHGSRELVLPSLPFVIVYRVLEDAVEIATVRLSEPRRPNQTHSAREASVADNTQEAGRAISSHLPPAAGVLHTLELGGAGQRCAASDATLESRDQATVSIGNGRAGSRNMERAKPAGLSGKGSITFS